MNKTYTPFISDELLRNMFIEGTPEYIEPAVVTVYKKGGRIHIKKKNRGKFTEYCGGNVTEECIAKGKKSKDPKIRKRATFAANARKWKHENGGILKAQKGVAISSERIPTLEEYIQMKQQEARQMALANSYNAVKPRPAKKYYTEDELNDLQFKWRDLEGGSNVFNEYAEEKEKKLNHPLAPKHLFIFNPIYRNDYYTLNDSGEKLLKKLNFDWISAMSYENEVKAFKDRLDYINKHGYDWTGYNCITNATGWYGDPYVCASNIDFKKDPSKYGFVEINADDALPGDIFQYDENGRPYHATMYVKRGDYGTYYTNYANGDYLRDIIHDSTLWVKGQRAFRFVGLPKDIETWTREYNELYSKKFGGILDKFKKGGILKYQNPSSPLPIDLSTSPITRRLPKLIPVPALKWK